MNQSNSAPSWYELERRAQLLARRRMEIQARRNAEANRRQTLLSQALAAQARLDAAPSVQEILEEVQRQAHEHAVGAYEQMLSALLADVLPGERDVVLDLHVDRGVSGMDIFIRKGEGQPLEDAWLGTGGSVTNLLSTGLRLVALMRSGRRRFMVLDESDCWIKPELVGRYAAVVAEMARELGVQILMISHHDEALFAEHIPYRLQMTRLGSTVSVEWTAYSEVPSWSPEEEGIRSIGLFDFQSHQNTIVPMAPGVTLLQGDNDIGKSAVVNALRAVFDGNSNETMIRHFAPRARVEIDLGQRLLTWIRNRKGKVKVSYELTDSATGQVIHSSVGTQPPEWLIANIGIGKVDDLDIQIGQQQDPVFLLNQPASKRAKALAVGQESGHIQAMMALDKQEQQAARATLKQCEQEIEALRLMELASRGIEQSTGPQQDIIIRARQRAEELSRAQGLLVKWRRALAVVDAGILPAHKPVAPTLYGNQSRLLLDRWKALAGKINSLALIRNGEKLPNLPQPQAPEIEALFRRWGRLLRITEPGQALRNSTAPRQVPVAQAPHTKALAGAWARASLRAQILGALRQFAHPVAPRIAPKEAQAILGRWKPLLDRQTALAALRDSQPNLSLPQIKAGDLQNRLNDWKQALEKIQAATRDIAALERQEAETRSQLIEKYPFCPTCGQEIKP